MKKSELDKSLRKIEEDLEKSELVDACINVARELGKGETKSHRWYTSEDYDYKEGDLEINYHDGYSEFGGGKLDVKHEGLSVFSIKREIGDDYPYPKIIRQNAMQFGVERYVQGKWEEKIVSLSRKAISIQKARANVLRRKEREKVDSKLVEDIQERFPGLI